MNVEEGAGAADVVVEAPKVKVEEAVELEGAPNVKVDVAVLGTLVVTDPNPDKLVLGSVEVAPKEKLGLEAAVSELPKVKVELEAVEVTAAADEVANEKDGGDLVTVAVVTSVLVVAGVLEAPNEKLGGLFVASGALKFRVTDDADDALGVLSLSAPKLKLRLGFGIAVVTEVVVVEVVKLELALGEATDVPEPNVKVADDVAAGADVVNVVVLSAEELVEATEPKLKVLAVSVGFSLFLSVSSSSSKADINFSTRLSSRLLSCSSFSGLEIKTVSFSLFSFGGSFSFTVALTISEIFGTIIFCCWADLSTSSAKATFLTGAVDVPLSTTFRRFFFC